MQTDLVVIATPTGARSDGQICITIDDGKEFTWVSGPMELRHVVESYADDLDPVALGALVTEWQLCIVDPVWARNDFLWLLVLKAVQ